MGSNWHRQRRFVAESPTRYRAFVSYSHQDRPWAQWLHRSLENFRIDKDLIGRKTPVGPIPKTLRPIFLDRDDFPAGHSLTRKTRAALEASNSIIVICSPAAVRSNYVNEEIRIFKSLNPNGNVVPLIVAGEPNDPAQECFPAALRFRVDHDGLLTTDSEEPIAADARSQGDGKELAKQKVVAGLLGVDLDEVVRRAERAHNRHKVFLIATVALLLFLTAAASISSIYARKQLRTNEAFLRQTLVTATGIVNTAVTQAERYNVPRSATLQLLSKAEALFDNISEYGRPTAELQFQKAKMMIAFARNYSTLGDTDMQLQRATEAHRLLSDLATKNPDNPVYRDQLSTALVDVGDALVERGKLVEALDAYHSALAIAKQLSSADPENVWWQDTLAISYDRIGVALTTQRGYDVESLAAYHNSLAIREALAKSDPSNVEWQHGLSVSYNEIGHALSAEGKYDEALNSFRNALTIREMLVQADTKNTRLLRDLGVSYSDIGETLKAMGQLNEALTTFRQNASTLERLVEMDASNTGWQRDLSVAYLRIGDLLEALGDHVDALTTLQGGLSMATRLSIADPSNVRWQSDLADYEEKIGEVFLAQEQLTFALNAFQNCLAIRNRLAQSVLDNPGMHLDLSIIYSHIGHVQAIQGRFSEALASDLDSLAALEQMAAIDSTDERIQQGLALAHGSIASVYREMDRPAEALSEFRQGRQILAALIERSANTEKLNDSLAVFDRDISALER
jgi:tetratricopeptide (TPR) repeat protein